MRHFMLILALLSLFLFSLQALAEDADDGPVVIVEFASLNLDGDDDVKIFRMIPGYTFKSGIQVGANLAVFSLDRPSVKGVAYYEGCPQLPGDPFYQDQDTYTLEPAFSYWGFGPMLGLDVELIEGWIGLEFMVTPTFPITNDSSGWSIEVGGFAYFSLEGITDEWLDLAFMAGLKFGHYDVEADRTKIEENRMMPGFGAMLQF